MLVSMDKFYSCGSRYKYSTSLIVSLEKKLNHTLALKPESYLCYNYK